MHTKNEILLGEIIAPSKSATSYCKFDTNRSLFQRTFFKTKYAILPIDFGIFWDCIISWDRLSDFSNLSHVFWKHFVHVHWVLSSILISILLYLVIWHSHGIHTAYYAFTCFNSRTVRCDVILAWSKHDWINRLDEIIDTLRTLSINNVHVQMILFNPSHVPLVSQLLCWTFVEFTCWINIFVYKFESHSKITLVEFKLLIYIWYITLNIVLWKISFQRILIAKKNQSLNNNNNCYLRSRFWF